MEQGRNGATCRVTSEENILSWVLPQAIFNLSRERHYQLHSRVREAAVCIKAGSLRL
jgi:hypothetical protein